MKIDSCFSGNYLKAADVAEPQLHRMAGVKIVDLGDGEEKPVLYFDGQEHGLVLNRTNANTIAALYGDETDNWHGKPIVIFQTQVDFRGRPVPGIRVRAPKPGSVPGAPEAPADDPNIPF